MVSSYGPIPSWQSSSVTGCGNREDNDVSADADPNTGAAIYNSYGEGDWLQVGGTFESSPIIAAVYALAGAPGASTYPAQDIWTYEPIGCTRSAPVTPPSPAGAPLMASAPSRASRPGR
jgi:hypothetical protein